MSMMNAQQHAQQWGQLVSQAGRDATFRSRLLAEPATVAREFGLQVPADVELRVVENTPRVLHLTLPPLETDGQPRELSDTELNEVTGGLVVIAIIAILIPLLVPHD
jgi:Nitrile hydratase, alpha chain